MFLNGPTQGLWGLLGHRRDPGLFSPGSVEMPSLGPALGLKPCHGSRRMGEASGAAVAAPAQINPPHTRIDVSDTKH